MTKRNISLQKNTKFLSNYCSVFKTILSSYGLWINREIKVTAWMWWCLWRESELLEARVSNTEVVKHAVSLVTARLLLRQALPRSQHLQSSQSPTIGRGALSHNPGDHVNAACVLLSHCVTCGVGDCPLPPHPLQQLILTTIASVMGEYSWDQNQFNFLSTLMIEVFKVHWGEILWLEESRKV